MITCARCGRVAGEGDGECYVSVAGDECEGALLPAIVECREAELANLRSLLRSVTGKLEEAAESVLIARDQLDGADRNQWDAQQAIDLALRDINSVLEALS